MWCEAVLGEVADDGGYVEGFDAQAQVVEVAAFTAGGVATT